MAGLTHFKGLYPFMSPDQLFRGYVMHQHPCSCCYLSTLCILEYCLLNLRLLPAYVDYSQPGNQLKILIYN